MEETNNYSNDCLFDCKERVRECVSSSSLNISCDDITNALHEEIDVDKFKTWLERNINTFKTKQDIQSYFNRAFFKELDKGTFKLAKKVEVERVVEVTSLSLALREKGIEVLGNHTCYIEIMWQHIIRKGMKEIDAIELNHEIVGGMKSGQTVKDYIALVKKHIKLKGYKVDWEAINKEYQVAIDEWTRILNEISLEALPND